MGDGPLGKQENKCFEVKDVPLLCARRKGIITLLVLLAEQRYGLHGLGFFLADPGCK